jgi:hypothetical protein
MTSDALRAFFRAGIFLVVVSFGLVLTTRPETAEFVVSVCSLMIGGTLVGLIVFVNWLAQR